METRLRILKSANDLFRKFGIKSVTMDAIAQELGMSKKTIYQHFSNKADIVMGITQEHIQQEKVDFSEIRGKARDAVEEMILVMQWISRGFQDISPGLIYDLKKYYPQSWNTFQEFKNGFIQRTIRENLERGLQEGFYRNDMDLDIMVKLRLDEVEFFLLPNEFPGDPKSLTHIHQQLLAHYIHGLVTFEGKKLIQKYISKD